MITDRDYKVIEFIEQFKVASTSTITELFYPSLRVAQRRLTEIIKYSDIKRTRYTIDTEYIYYLKKTSQEKHNLILTNFYRELHKRVEILRFDKEFTKIKSVRPDAFIAYKYKSKTYIAFVEVEISNKGLDTEKYKELYLNKKYKECLPIFPKIIAITNRNFDKQAFEIHKLSTNLDNIGTILG